MPLVFCNFRYLLISFEEFIPTLGKVNKAMFLNIEVILLGIFADVKSKPGQTLKTEKQIAGKKKNNNKFSNSTLILMKVCLHTSAGTYNILRDLILWRWKKARSPNF